MICADHGLAIVYFLQSDVVSTLLDAGIRVVLLTDDSVADQVAQRFGRPGLTVAGLRLDQARRFEAENRPELQWWLHFLRRVGGSSRINTEAMDSYIDQVAVEQSNWRRIFMPLARLAIMVLRHSAWARRILVRAQQRLRPAIYQDLFEEHQPALVVASTAGWRLDRYLLREAAAAGIRTATAIIGWDNPSSYSIPGAPVDDVTCWSDIQKRELVLGSDWDPAAVHIGGIPTYDGYLDGRWRLERGEYLERHGLDPQRKLLSYACSFVSFSPNFQNIEALASLVNSDSLAEPCQLLVRLHPNHFLDVHLFRDERRRIHELAQASPHIHVVEPVPLGGSLGHYSGEDMEEKASMLAHSDVFLTVYSTMVVEAAVHGRPIVSVCIDQPGGWNWPRKYSLRLSEIGKWPTHLRFRESGAGRVTSNRDELGRAIDYYLGHPQADEEAMAAFVAREITYTDGSAGRRTGEYLRGLVLGEHR
jgi:hypothetical protein